MQTAILTGTMVLPPRSRPALLAVLLFFIVRLSLPTSSSAAQSQHRLADYAGEWVCKYEGRNLIVLNLKYANGQVSGAMFMPKHMRMGQGGVYTHISPEVGEEEVREGELVGDHLEFTSQRNQDENRFSMRLDGSARAFLGMVGIPLQPWLLLRVPDSVKATVATSWPSSGPKNVTKEIAELQAQLKFMYDEDQSARLAQAQPGPDPRINQIDAKNYPQLLRIYQRFGLPRISQVGRDAAGEFWLLVQHQDDHLDFQKRVLSDMKQAVEEGEASEVNYAYLYDRVKVNEKKPQHWGTQITCQKGEPVLSPVDDPVSLDERRETIGLMPLKNYLETLAPNCRAAAATGSAAKKKAPQKP